VLLLGEWDQDASIKELKESVVKLKEEKEKAAFIYNDGIKLCYVCL